MVMYSVRVDIKAEVGYVPAPSVLFVLRGEHVYHKISGEWYRA